MKNSYPALLMHEFRYDTLIFLRNSRGAFFALGLPVMFLVIFGALFRNSTVQIAEGRLSASVYYVPNLIAFGVISAAFANLVLSVTAAREAGIYKRRRATPVPPGVIIGGRALTALGTALAIAIVLIAIGWPAYGASLPISRLPALITDLLVGALAFCCLGYAVVSFARDEDSMQAITQAIVLPLYFISGVFVSSALIPNWLTRIASFFPVRHLAQALLASYNPNTTGLGFAWHDLAIVAVWGLAGLAVALRRFTWLPRGH